ncbi:hypothetical protein J4207_01560 [Candidatus Woesearchaeota archaeon]|nr:hypothetical protein [Candidatus Woesearchaeota archaeon]
MLNLGTLLRHYKRKDIQDAMVEHAKDREVAPRYDDQFGSRPDMLQHGNDILEFAKKSATSFHCSEERWQNPLRLSPELKPYELAALRIGWDLLIDVDCKRFPSNSAATKDFILAFHSKLSRRKSMEKMQKNCFLTVHAVLHNILFICLKRDFQESLHVKTFRILPKRLVLILMNSFFVCVRAVA